MTSTENGNLIRYINISLVKFSPYPSKLRYHVFYSSFRSPSRSLHRHFHSWTCSNPTWSNLTHFIRSQRKRSWRIHSTWSVWKKHHCMSSSSDYQSSCLFTDLFIDQIGVPGAFTGTCNAQVPGYIKAYDDFKAKGIKNIYVISVNDVFVMKWVIYAMLITHILIVWRAWKERLAPEGTSEY